MPTFGRASLDRLTTCDPRLQTLFHEVIKHRDCAILEGYRPQDAQDKVFREGRSKTPWPNSKHNKSPSLAVDVMPWHAGAPHIRWDDKTGLTEFAGFVMGVASQMGIRVRWGGHFRGFYDGPHWELIE